MSLALLEGYSSAEEEDQELAPSPSAFSSDVSSGDDDDDDDGEPGFPSARREKKRRHRYAPPRPAAPNRSLPSALDVFAEITGPPEFLNNAMASGDLCEQAAEVDLKGRKRPKEKKELPAGAVLEGKPQLAVIRDRVRTDMEGSTPASGFTNASSGESKRVFTASNPDAKEASDLLSLCMQCGIPKTYSHNRGMVCPQCGDRPPADPTKDSEKKKGSTIKDKEKSKRMRGQSSHTTWKSETEMQLRQQYD